MATRWPGGGLRVASGWLWAAFGILSGRHYSPDYDWAKIEKDRVGPRRLCRQGLSLAVAPSVTCLSQVGADFNYS